MLKLKMVSAWMFFLVLLTSCAAVHKQASMARESDDVDLEIIFRIFRASYQPDRDLRLTTIYPSPLGSPTVEARAYAFRCHEYSIVHRALLQHDPDYATRFRRAEIAVLAQSNPATVLHEGRGYVQQAFQANDIISDLLNAAGPRDPHLRARAVDWNPQGPFISGPLGFDSFEPSARIFYYCSNGLAVSGDTSNPYVRAHRELRDKDAAYSGTFSRIAQETGRRASDIDPTNFVARTKLTDYVRGAISNSEIKRKLESVVAIEKRSSLEPFELQGGQ